MSYNLALLPPEEKQTIETDKQASYDVWQVKQNKEPSSSLAMKQKKISDPKQREVYETSVEKYRIQMRV